MTGTYTQESVISNLTLALLEDSGSVLVRGDDASSVSLFIDGTMFRTSTVNLFFGDAVSAVNLLNRVVKTGSIQNWPSSSSLHLLLSTIIDRFSRENPHPFCVPTSKASLAKRTCAYTYDKFVICNLIEYNQPLPIEYQVNLRIRQKERKTMKNSLQVFDSLPNMTNAENVSRFGGQVMLANYCPYEQEVAYNNSHRDSRCYRPENQPPGEAPFFELV